MKKIVPILLLLGTLLISPLALAQEQTYSGFERFIDSARMLFSFGDKKVMLALNIREKELNSAIVNTKNGNVEGAETNLEQARKKLLYVQTKVSKNIAEDVKTNTDGVINKINDEENLPSPFQTYILEEEKTQLTAELVSKVEEKEGQSLTREMVKDIASGESRVEIKVEGNTEVAEIKMRIDKIDNMVAASENKIETPPKIKEREDVKPAPNVFDNEVDDTFVGPGGPGPGVIDDD